MGQTKKGNFKWSYALIPNLTMVLMPGDKVILIGILSVILSFLYVAICPFCRKRESLWLFVISALNMIPFNILVCNAAHLLACYLLSLGKLGAITLYFMIYIILFCVEEVFIGIMGRFIWRRQYALKMDAPLMKIKGLRGDT